MLLELRLLRDFSCVCLPSSFCLQKLPSVNCLFTSLIIAPLMPGSSIVASIHLKDYQLLTLIPSYSLTLLPAQDRVARCQMKDRSEPRSKSATATHAAIKTTGLARAMTTRK